MRLQKFSNIVIKIMWAALSVSLVLWAIFFYLNWEYISNPSLNPYYSEVTSVFAYNDGLAVFTAIGFELPGTMITLVLLLHSSLLIFYIIRHHLNLSIKNWITIISIVLFGLYFEYVRDILIFMGIPKRSVYEFEHIMSGCILFTVFFSMLFSFVGSLIMLFVSRIKKNLRFLFLGLFSSLMYFSHWVLIFMLFFD